MLEEGKNTVDLSDEGGVKVLVRQTRAPLGALVIEGKRRTELEPTGRISESVGESKGQKNSLAFAPEARQASVRPRTMEKRK